MGENFRNLAEKRFWWGELSLVSPPKDATPLISQRKLSQIAAKPRNSRKLSPSKVSHYTVPHFRMFFLKFVNRHSIKLLQRSPLLLCALFTLINLCTSHIWVQYRVVHCFLINHASFDQA